jgi:Peptidase C39 family
VASSRLPLLAGAGLARLARAPRWLTARWRRPIPGRRLRSSRIEGQTSPPDGPANDSLAQAFEQLCRKLGRPFSAAEIRAAAPPSEPGMSLGNLLLASERLGFKAAEFKPDVGSLAQMPPPFLVVGRQPGEGWLAEARIKDHLVVSDSSSGRSALHLETVADLALRVVLLKPLVVPAGQRQWRDTIMRRLRPVLWELGLASVVINLLALATPLFLMTVYNTVSLVLPSASLSIRTLISPSFSVQPARTGIRISAHATEFGSNSGSKREPEGRELWTGMTPAQS